MTTSLPDVARRRGRGTAPEGQGATFVELFFDLVFVFAVTEITARTTTNLTWLGVAQSVLVFWLIWWAWSQFTWALNPADTNHGVVRVGTLAATAIAFLMAVAVGDAFGDGGLWFVLPYVAVRLLGLGLYGWVAAEERAQLVAVQTFAALSLLGLASAVIGGVVDTPARSWFWLATIALDFTAAAVAGRRQGWKVRADHFAERHGLFVIIALGESLVIAGITAAGEERTAELMLVAIAAVLVATLLWWSYFGWLKDDLEHELDRRRGIDQSTLARDAYSLWHFPLIAGVVGIAIGVEAMVAHPDEALPARALTALIVGLVLFVGSAAGAWWRAHHRLLTGRLTLLGGMAVALAVAGSADPGWILGIVAVGLVGIVLLERGAGQGTAS